MNMQGSINRLTDTIEKSLVHPLEVVPPVPPAPPTMISCGLTIMRSADADLGVEQRAILLWIFTHAGGENNLAAYVNLKLEDDFELHCAFISGLLYLYCVIECEYESEKELAGLGTMYESEKELAGLGTMYETEKELAGLETMYESENELAGPGTDQE
ncbi:hypothetical protein C8R48DRAFT_671777 [Suillus tomentosus]|nr:hypothetical protein C8R48DRAFT_671777 [Suillus tomentosus]